MPTPDLHALKSHLKKEIRGINPGFQWYEVFVLDGRVLVTAYTLSKQTLASVTYGQDDLVYVTLPPDRERRRVHVTVHMNSRDAVDYLRRHFAARSDKAARQNQNREIPE